jgi:serine/threonine protein kinase
MIGKVISGRYQILQALGNGGFGETFLAEDLQLPDHQKCVVKRLQPTSSDTFVLEIASRLFETEARVLHKLGIHDRIPRLLAHFEEDHQFYLVQELIDGYELTNEIISIERAADGYPVGRMNESQAIAFLIDVLETLVFVHQQGAIHRDIKPANLMRRRTDGSGLRRTVARELAHSCNGHVAVAVVRAGTPHVHVAHLR